MKESATKEVLKCYTNTFIVVFNTYHELTVCLVVLNNSCNPLNSPVLSLLQERKGLSTFLQDHIGNK